MENQGNQPRRTPQNRSEQQQQRIRQYEQIANHYTEAAIALRNNDEETCDRCLQQVGKVQLQNQFPDDPEEDQSNNPGTII